jgi:signal transduction histidine kinase
LTSNDGTLVLTVHDNGQGIREHLGTGGIGLVSMRERAISIGAAFRIISTATMGTTIEVAVPLNLSERQGVTA